MILSPTAVHPYQSYYRLSPATAFSNLTIAFLLLPSSLTRPTIAFLPLFPHSFFHFLR
ncbi:hypothetical protein HMPREF6123_2194 [Oribacterium sinus F0268]|uniref:Uncharacterized protein n=1 Tax=Oribacterium sinus F0268 TaxID=585501 RepID=C2L0C5_9FIRM|nr:hypothetical protein HMPREF6123_2194 [Oribacterium sinus F0268]